jgi:uncharacterized protein YbbC (DUF1343 family)
MKISNFTKLSTALTALILITGCAQHSVDTSSTNTTVLTGAEIMISNHLEELSGRNIGLVMNPTARVGDIHVLDTLLALNINIKALYAPEHGFRGDFGAGERITDGIDEESGLPVFSLYGERRKPDASMLEGVDLLLFDMQDVGARFYTYLSTMGLVMEAAAENDIEIWILDRPNPAGGDYVSGWMLDPKHTSFVGAYPIPIAHGMTLGELAHMIVGEEWLTAEEQVNLRVIGMQNWSRSMKWPETGLNWIPPSPNLPTFEHAFIYLGTCLIEGTTMSEGRGTTDSFLLVGAPNLQIDASIKEYLSEEYHVSIADSSFIPIEIPGRALRPKHENSQLPGLYISVPEDNFSSIDPVAFGHELLREMLRASSTSTTNNFLYRLSGTDEIIAFLEGDDDPRELWKEEIDAFKLQRLPYLLY